MLLPVGAGLARDKNNLIYLSHRIACIASKLCSHGTRSSRRYQEALSKNPHESAL